MLSHTPNQLGETALILAAQAGAADCVAALVSVSGIDVNLRNKVRAPHGT